MNEHDWTKDKRKERDARIFAAWKKECDISGGLSLKEFGSKFGLTGDAISYIIKRENKKECKE